jgi:hypothetical protein
MCKSTTECHHLGLSVTMERVVPEGNPVKLKPKQVLIALLVAFALVAVIQHPTNSARNVRAAGGVATDAVSSVVDFFDALSS